MLLVDEFDVAAFDERAAAWWLRQRQARGAEEYASAQELVGEHRAHLHPLERIVGHSSRTSTSVRRSTAYLYRWDLGEALRHQEDAIARAEIPAVGARLLAQRDS